MMGPKGRLGKGGEAVGADSDDAFSQGDSRTALHLRRTLAGQGHAGHVVGSERRPYILSPLSPIQTDVTLCDFVVILINSARSSSISSFCPE